MKRVIVKLDESFEDLLQKLGSTAKNSCLLSGDGWQEKIAWNPCDSYRLAPDSGMNDGLQAFIAEHQTKKHLVIGFLNYDLGYELHGLNKTKNDDIGLPKAVFFAYENYLEKTDEKIYVNYENEAFLNELSAIKNIRIKKDSSAKLKFKPVWDRKSYSDAFRKIKGYIYDGQIYQINLTQRLEAEGIVDPRALFADLSNSNIAKMKAYFEGDDFELLSMSPERFIRTQKDVIETSPIKGTRPRGENAIKDKENELSLLADEKEKAELNMITDLLRNDLGKVCRPGSVIVSEKRKIERLTSVMHTFSLIKGVLRPDIGAFEALISMFPGGSISGCPKRKSMEIIDELEGSARGGYCGNIICIDSKGNLDSSILIRTIIRKGQRFSLSVGSGIVYDSIEQKEYRENLDKALPLTDLT